MNHEPTIFLSYSREDTPFARQLADRLLQHGAKVWFDRDEIAFGEDWVVAIEQAMAQCDFTFLLVSQRYRSESFSNYERAVALKLAEEGRTKLVPVLLPGASFEDLPHTLRRFHSIDLTGSSDESFNELARALSAA